MLCRRKRLPQDGENCEKQGFRLNEFSDVVPDSDSLEIGRRGLRRVGGLPSLPILGTVRNSKLAGACIENGIATGSDWPCRLRLAKSFIVESQTRGEGKPWRWDEFPSCAKMESTGQSTLIMSQHFIRAWLPTSQSARTRQSRSPSACARAFPAAPSRPVPAASDTPPHPQGWSDRRS